jgi:hypothetical protein
MKLQFRTSTLLYVTAFVAIACAGVFGMARIVQGLGGDLWNEVIFGFCLILAPIWLPFLFVAYALGRRSLNRNILIAFAVTELATLAAIYAWAQWAAASPPASYGAF